MLHDLEHFSLPEIEEKVLKFWKEHAIFQKSLDQRNTGKKKIFRFFEGPPTANGKPGIHHVLARSFKDIMLRYKTMRGYYVPRKAGWDTHGLPVEIAIEKSLGIKRKSEIEKFGIAEFNARAKASVWQYKAEWEKLTERTGFWLDFNDPYITYDNRYIESIWWILKEVHKQGLLKKLHKVVPWCPRCETTLSSHELGMPGAYQKVKDPSVYVKLRIKNKEVRSKNNEYFLVWTTTPWTLPANMAIAVNPKLEYTKYRIGEELFWSATMPPNPQSLEMEVIEKCSGKKLVGMRYEPLYSSHTNKRSKKCFTVMGADFVALHEGTGLVHIAPAFGEDDLAVWRKEADDEEIMVTIDDRGLVGKGLPGAGTFIKEADKAIAADLKDRNLLYHESVIEHEYPFCWRCASPLIYFARSAWFILMSKKKEELLNANSAIHWIPAHIKEGRFGAWLKEAKDWALSRERYWGTPLPIWECKKCGREEVIGSLKELRRRTSRGNQFFLVRHGEADHNLQEYFAGGPERETRASHLTARGKEQAHAMGAALKKKGVSVLVASPYTRTRETARIIAKATGAKVMTDARLGEVNAGTFNNRPLQEYWAFFPGRRERLLKAPPGGESLLDVRARMMATLRDIDARYENTTIGVVSHGDPLLMLDGAMRGEEAEKTALRDSLEPGMFMETPFESGPYTSVGDLDLHRPYIDTISFPCDACGTPTVRVREVADVWLDSGAMPFAQWHYPFENKEMIDEGLQFPADYIAEGIDQTRGWFYSLLNVGVLLGKGPAYEHVISLGLLLDKQGQKMSKSKGNVVDPWEMIGKYGADTVRWYFFGASDPGEPKRFDEVDLGKTLRKLFLILYNSFSFWEGYMQLHGVPRNETKPPSHLLDRWVLLRANEVVRSVTRFLDRYEIGRAARTIEEFVEDISHWYIRRSRRRFADGDADARTTMGNVLLILAKLMAPFTPFFAEALYCSCVRYVHDGDRAESVHLADWPETDTRGASFDATLLETMARVRLLSSSALAKRAEAKVKVRQPLAALTVYGDSLGDEYVEILKDEVNVKEIRFVSKPVRGDKDEQRSQEEVILDTEITPALREEGRVREVIRMIQQLRQDAGLGRGEKIALIFFLPDALRALLERTAGEWQTAVGAEEVTYLTLETTREEIGHAKLETQFEGNPLRIVLKRK